MTFSEGLKNAAENFRKRPFGSFCSLLGYCVWKFGVFWFYALLAAGFVAMAILYMAQDALPYMGYDVVTLDTLARIRSFSVLLGFTAVFGFICFRFVWRLTIGKNRKPKPKKRVPMFLRDPRERA